MGPQLSPGRGGGGTSCVLVKFQAFCFSPRSPQGQATRILRRAPPACAPPSWGQRPQRAAVNPWSSPPPDSPTHLTQLTEPTARWACPGHGAGSRPSSHTSALREALPARHPHCDPLGEHSCPEPPRWPRLQQGRRLRRFVLHPFYSKKGTGLSHSRVSVGVLKGPCAGWPQSCPCRKVGRRREAWAQRPQPWRHCPQLPARGSPHAAPPRPAAPACRLTPFLGRAEPFPPQRGSGCLEGRP